MQVIKTIKTLGSNFLDLVFPVYCIVCGKDGVFLCAECTPKLVRLNQQKCIRCENPSPFGKTHPDCASRNVVDGCLSALDYKDRNNKNLIRVYKYKFISDLNENLAAFMTEEIKSQNLANYLAGFTVMPVPLHKRRFHWRGFNQSELLAKKIAEKLGLNFESDLVIRSKNTKPQVDLKAEERKKNIENAFALSKALENKNYLLVDDVVTTGSTLNEIAKLLKKEGANQVWAITLARG